MKHAARQKEAGDGPDSLGSPTTPTPGALGSVHGGLTQGYPGPQPPFCTKSLAWTGMAGKKARPALPAELLVAACSSQWKPQLLPAALPLQVLRTLPPVGPAGLRVVMTVFTVTRPHGGHF